MLKLGVGWNCGQTPGVSRLGWEACGCRSECLGRHRDWSVIWNSHHSSQFVMGAEAQSKGAQEKVLENLHLSYVRETQSFSSCGCGQSWTLSSELLSPETCRRMFEGHHG